MHSVFRRKALATIAAIFSLTALPAAAVVATPTPALASVNLCNVFGDNLCLGDPGTVSNGDVVVLTNAPGRQINRLDQGFTCCNGHEVYRLQFAAAPSQCVGISASNSQGITVRDCSGGNSSNVNWAQVSTVNGTEWLSTTTGLYLASDNALNVQLFVFTLDGCNGCLFKWTN